MFAHSCNRHKPIIGIIGGTGPEATVHFQMTILKVMQDIIRPEKDQDYYPMLIDNDPTIPDRSCAILNKQDIIIKLYINKIMRLQTLGTKVIVIACNTAHAFLPQIQRSVTIPIINIIDEVAKDFVIHNKKTKKVGVLSTIGTFTSRIYQKAFLKYDVKVEELTTNCLQKVHAAIYGIKAGMSSPTQEYDIKKLYLIYGKLNINLSDDLIKPPYLLLIDALEEMKAKEIEHVILGCTEIPLILNVLTLNGLKLYNPAIATAKKILFFCKHLEKTKNTNFK